MTTDDLRKAAEQAAEAYQRETCLIPAFILREAVFIRLMNQMSALNGRWLMLPDQIEAVKDGVRAMAARVVMGIVWSKVTKVGGRPLSVEAEELEKGLREELAQFEVALRNALVETLKEADTLREKLDERNEQILRSLHGD